MDDLKDMAWHDNIEAAEIEGGSALDVNNLLFGLERVLEVKTGKGSLFFRKISDKVLREIKDRHEAALVKMTETQVEALRILAKDRAEWTNDELVAVVKFGEAGRPYSMELTHTSLVKPRMTLEQFYDVMATLSLEDSTKVLKTVASIYNPPEAAKEQAKRLLDYAARYKIPIAEKLTMENITPDLLKVMDEIAQDEEAALRNVGGR